MAGKPLCQEQIPRRESLSLPSERSITSLDSRNVNRVPGFKEGDIIQTALAGRWTRSPEDVMPEEIRIWSVGDGDRLTECARRSLDLESRLEEWLARDITILDGELIVIGRQVETAFGGIIDLLCINRAGDLVIVELKRDKTPRDVTAQALDYASWVKDLSSDKITDIADNYLSGDGPLDHAFKRQFNEELPDSLNDNHRMIVVGSKIDPSSERIIKYLSDTYGIDINGATFQFFDGDDGGELLARVFLIDPSQIEYQSQTKRSTKRRPNLTYEQLETIAEERRVGEIYRYCVDRLGDLFSKGTTRSSIRFTGNFEGSRKAVINLIPSESSSTSGLHFQVYIQRLCSLFDMKKEEATGLLPERKKPWIYYESAGPDFSGFAGYFTTREEIDILLNGLRRPRSS